MEIQFNKIELCDLVEKQLNNFFNVSDRKLLEAGIEEVMERIEKCFRFSKNKYFNNNGKIVFSPYHSVQYSIFLYYLANSIGKLSEGDVQASKIYYLNKIMNSVDWFYQIELPEVFCAEHPMGSVLGRANYKNKFFIYQGVTVGGNKGEYPTIGENVLLYSNATVLGNSHIGDNVIVSANAYIKSQDVPSNCIVFGSSPNLIIKKKTIEEIKEMTSHIWNW